jgi:hypothetical protein
MNQFDHSGPQLLSSYLVLAGIGLSAGVVLRHLLRLPSDDVDSSNIMLDNYELAYLAGRKVQAVNRLQHSHRAVIGILLPRFAAKWLALPWF